MTDSFSYELAYKIILRTLSYIARLFGRIATKSEGAGKAFAISQCQDPCQYFHGRPPSSECFSASEAFQTRESTHEECCGPDGREKIHGKGFRDLGG